VLYFSVFFAIFRSFFPLPSLEIFADAVDHKYPTFSNSPINFTKLPVVLSLLSYKSTAALLH